MSATCDGRVSGVSSVLRYEIKMDFENISSKIFVVVSANVCVSVKLVFQLSETIDNIPSMVRQILAANNC